MSWGIKITILYCGFVVLILSLVGLTMRENNDLVAADYYQQELRYQDKIDRMNRTHELPAQPEWQISTGKISFVFPTVFNGNEINGAVYLQRPSDAKLDKRIPLTIDDAGHAQIITSTMKPGIYKMEMSWSAGGQEYYNESVIQLK